MIETKPRDKATYKEFPRTGWLEYEPILKAELKTMLARPAKSRLADLAQVGVEYLAMFVAAKVQAMSRSRLQRTTNAPIDRWSARQLENHLPNLPVRR